MGCPPLSTSFPTDSLIRCTCVYSDEVSKGIIVTARARADLVLIVLHSIVQTLFDDEVDRSPSVQILKCLVEIRNEVGVL